MATEIAGTWTKVGTTLVPIITASLALFSWFGGGWGKLYQVENLEVYYRAGITEAEARAVGDYLFEQGLGSEQRISVQLASIDTGITLRIVIDEAFRDDPEVIAGAEDLEAELEPLFPGRNTQVEMTNDRFSSFRVIDLRQPNSVTPAK